MDIETVGITRADAYRIGAIAMVVLLGSFAWVFALRVQVRKRTRQLQEANEKLHHLSGQLMEAQEEERKRISREIHDELGQFLTSICIDLERAKKAPVLHRQGQLIDRALHAAQQGMEQVRALSFLIRPRVIDDLGLKEAIKAFISEFELGTKVKVKASLRFENHDIPSVIDTNAYRILQESLNNVYKHAGQKKATVEVWTENGRLLLTVEDRGKGFDPDAIQTNNTLGIIGMKERARLLGGTLTVVSSPGRGTKLSLSVPLHQ